MRVHVNNWLNSCVQNLNLLNIDLPIMNMLHRGLVWSDAHISYDIPRE